MHVLCTYITNHDIKHTQINTDDGMSHNTEWRDVASPRREKLITFARVSKVVVPQVHEYHLFGCFLRQPR
jgi:hypothetical protein